MLTVTSGDIRTPGNLIRAAQAPTFSELVTEYIDRHAKRFKRSWQEDERILDHGRFFTTDLLAAAPFLSPDSAAVPYVVIADT